MKKSNFPHPIDRDAGTLIDHGTREFAVIGEAISRDCPASIFVDINRDPADLSTLSDDAALLAYIGGAEGDLL